MTDTQLSRLKRLPSPRRRPCWQAYVRVPGRLLRVGACATEQEAAQARDQRVLA
jgi:hypothetical protein